MKTENTTSAATETQNCFWELNLYTGKIYWSDGLTALLGLQKPYTPTLEQLIARYQPEKNLRPDLQRAVHQGIPFELEFPSVLPSGKLILVCTTANPVYDNYGKCIAIKGVLMDADESSALKSATTISENADELHIMLENFAKVISHNLRSHTSNLQMVLESINQKTSPKEMRHVLGNIKLISSNLNETVNYLNTLTQI